MIAAQRERPRPWAKYLVVVVDGGNAVSTWELTEEGRVAALEAANNVRGGLVVRGNFGPGIEVRR